MIALRWHAWNCAGEALESDRNSLMNRIYPVNLLQGRHVKQIKRGQRQIADPLISGGARRDRTVGLLNAIQALSQLSYSPRTDAVYIKARQACQLFLFGLRC